jgi:hypothetical protein
MLLHGGPPFLSNPIVDRVEDHRQSFNGPRDNPSMGSLPDIDTTILAAFGLGQGAYLTNKVVSSHS